LELPWTRVPPWIYTENYLLAFEEELKKAENPDSLINAMKEKFPSADLLLAIERGREGLMLNADKQTDDLVDESSGTSVSPNSFFDTLFNKRGRRSTSGRRCSDPSNQA